MKKGLILILTIGVFSIINTEMGVVGILPLISQNYGVTVATAGLLVSMFALVVAISGPTMPLFFSGVNRKKVMLLVLSVFTVCNVISAFASAFPVVLATRVIPAFFQPVYVSMAMSVAGSSVPRLISTSTGLRRQRRRRRILPTGSFSLPQTLGRQWGPPCAASSCPVWGRGTLSWEASSSSPAPLC